MASKIEDHAMTMKKIEILGTGCSKCRALERAVREALDRYAIPAEVAKVEEIDEIVRRGVMITPALIVDGILKSSGRVPSSTDLRALLS